MLARVSRKSCIRERRMGCGFCLQQLIPRTRVRFHTMEGGLDFISPIVVAYPYDSVTGLPTQVQQPNDIPGSQIGLNPGHEGSVEADVANLRFLQKALTSAIYSPDSYCKISVGAGFTAALNLTKDSHISLFTLSPSRTGVKITEPGYPGESCARSSRWEQFPKWGSEGREDRLGSAHDRSVSPLNNACCLPMSSCTPWRAYRIIMASCSSSNT